MITQQQYEAGINREAKPWMMLSHEAQAVIKAFGTDIEELSWGGAWQIFKGGEQRHAGCIYRIKPDTPYTIKGVVQAREIQGLCLRYTSNGSCILEFRDGSSVANISINSIISMCDQGMGHCIAADVLTRFENKNRPKE